MGTSISGQTLNGRLGSNIYYDSINASTTLNVSGTSTLGITVFPSITSSFLATDPTGKLIATTTPSLSGFALLNSPNTFTATNTFQSKVLVGVTDYTDFLNAQAIFSKGNSYHVSSELIGLVGESASTVDLNSSGLVGASKTYGDKYARGVSGIATVNNTLDSAIAYAGYFSSADVHVGGSNYGLYGQAVNGFNNYGVVGSAITIGAQPSWAVYGNAGVDSPSVTGNATAGSFLSIAAHNGANIGVYSNASGGTTNYAFFGADGDIYNNGYIKAGGASGSVYASSTIVSTGKINTYNKYYINDGVMLSATTTNVFVGNGGQSLVYAGSSSASLNASLGNGALLNITSGQRNLAMGGSALYTLTTATGNVGIGSQAGYLVTGDNNIFIGNGAGTQAGAGSNNTMIGYLSGYSNLTGSGNVFLGGSSGYNETGSNKLYISNSNTATPLLYGEFDNQILKINGSLQATGTSTISSLITGIRTITVSSTLTSLDYAVIASSTSALVIILPAPVNGRNFRIKQGDTGNVDIISTGYRIDGNVTGTLSSKYMSVDIIAQDNNYWIY